MSQTTDSSQPREILLDELEERLQAHRSWLDSGGRKGETANLACADLRGRDLHGAVLALADVHGANLSGADLTAALLHDANLQNADLKGAKGLLADQLAGANLSGAGLPPDVARFERLTQVDETSRIAQRLFVSLLLACVYVWLTIATTTDAKLLTNSASSPLPIIGTEIPIVGFYWVAPLVLVCLYVYLQLYLQRLWEGLAALPAVFPDGITLDRKVYPWLLNGLVCAHLTWLARNRPALSRLQVGLSVLLCWWVVPMTIFFFWARYLPRHDLGKWFLIALFSVAVAAAFELHRLAAATLRKRDLKKVRFYGRRTFVVVALGVGVALSFISYFTTVGASLRDEDISQKPADWIDSPEQFALVKGAKLFGADFRNARAERVFLAKAELHTANFAGAYLNNADLREAGLRDANMCDANLAGSKLQGAFLNGVDLRSAYLGEANFTDASLVVADLRYADLGQTNFTKATLVEADLQFADMRGTNFQEADLRNARFGYANFWRADHGVERIGGTVASPKLPSNLVNLSGADVKEAIFRCADLRGADLTKAMNLTQAQVDSACISDETLLPESIQRPGPCQCPEMSGSGDEIDTNLTCVLSRR